MKKLLLLSLCIGISGCATQFRQDKSTALYAALAQVTPGCDHSVGCIEKWDIARQWLQENAIADSATDTKSSGNVFSLSRAVPDSEKNYLIFNP